VGNVQLNNAELIYEGGISSPNKLTVAHLSLVKIFKINDFHIDAVDT